MEEKNGKNYDSDVLNSGRKIGLPVSKIKIKDYSVVVEDIKRNNGWKRIAKDVVLVYAFLGSCYMAGKDITGHPSADIVTGRSKPTALERCIMSLVDKKEDR